ncbi:hypothetical protein INR76_11110 [Marixanthomonas sp. SCSIO 43207]|uniref:hypothetical protein n=1 Tax=Marixanthomonas sp. SCSIO 43207 TaxID=2779360 RepID=UPI001CA8CAA5|nr:hypothetical protein [Marixanthomonas sp. SCSIO 43207]UAB80658.1 hypothetical protein INR76_11110 [Marixanthomonas sp. SCSIO 43207]
MLLSYYCGSCKKKNRLNYKVKDRFELQSQVGDYIGKNCDSCGIFEKKHINRLHAEPSRFIGLIALSIGIVLTLVVFKLGFIAVLTFTIPIWIYFDAYKNASDFNKIKISRRNK